MNDAIIASTSPSQLEGTRQSLDDHFKMTWTEKPKMLLGVGLTRNRKAGTLELSQRHYAQDILDTINMSNCTPKKYPLGATFPAFGKDQKPRPDTRFSYLQFIGKLNYLARSTRPDLAFAASHLATFCSTYQEEHWEACRDVMRYNQKEPSTSVSPTAGKVLTNPSGIRTPTTLGI